MKMNSVKYDLHIHSCLSPCGHEDMTPNNIAAMAMLCGLRAAALTDHNSAKNCPAFFAACRKRGIVPIAGMELTTSEEIHIICLFEALEDAVDFDFFVGRHRMKIKNKPEIFGRQIIMNEFDEVIGEEEELLIAATDLSVESAYTAAVKYGGTAFPAHIDKQANSIIGVLGTIPEKPHFFSAEFHDPAKIEKYRKRYPVLENMLILFDSDAHCLDLMSYDPPVFPDLADCGDEVLLRKKIISLIGGKM